MTFMIIGLTMISSAGVAEFDLATMVIGALVKGLILAVLVVAFSHWLFPDPANAPSHPPPALCRRKKWAGLHCVQPSLSYRHSCWP